MTLLSRRDRESKVWVDSGYVYKSQPKYLMDNECWCLSKMAKYGYVPEFERVEDELVRMEYLIREAIVNSELLLMHSRIFLHRLKEEGIRHGDLTMSHVFSIDDKIKVIDWAESRIWKDPRPDKRREGDEHWLSKTMMELIKKYESIK